MQHGNEDTFKEMLRIKRSVQAQYNTDVNFIASQALARSQQKPEDAENGEAANGADEKADAMAALERQARAPMGFVAATTGPQAGNIPQPEKAVVAANPDALDVDLDDE